MRSQPAHISRDTTRRQQPCALPAENEGRKRGPFSRADLTILTPYQLARCTPLAESASAARHRFRLMADFFHFVPGYKHYVYGAGREPLFFLLLTFLLTFATARSYTRLGRLHGWQSGSLKGVHLHHLVPGVIASLAAGTAIIAFRPGDDSMLLLSIL